MSRPEHDTSPYTLPCDAQAFLPHRPPMVLVTTLEWADANSATVTVLVTAGSPFAGAEGDVEQVALLEAMAQACAVHGGWLARSLGNKDEPAFLAGVRSFDILGSTVVGQAITVEVILEREFGGFHLFRTVARQKGQEVARAELKAYHRPNGPDGNPQ